jgi:hypothetical protein
VIKAACPVDLLGTPAFWTIRPDRTNPISPVYGTFSMISR